MKKWITVFLMLVLMMSLSAGALAADDYVLNETAGDLSGYFAGEELDALNARAADIWEKYGVAPYFVLTDDTEGMTTGTYAEWYYMEHDFIPVNAIVMVCNVDRWETKVYADGSICLDKLVVQDLDDMKAAYERDETYGGGVAAYLDVVQKCFGFNPLKALGIAAVAGIVVALVVVLVLRGQLKTVRAQRGAADYTRPGSMHITSSYERFLYRTVNRTPKSTDNGGSGGGPGGGGGAKIGGGLHSH